jgi:2-dehydro-3-deoxygluconokinase
LRNERPSRVTEGRVRVRATSDGLAVCVGEVMAQVIPDHGASLVDAASFSITSAGAESNVAQGLAQLGTRAVLVTRLGKDALGDRVLRDLRESGVELSHVRRSDGERTGVFLKDPGPDGSPVTYYRDGSAASRMSVGDVDSALKLRPEVLHLSGVTPALSHSCLEVSRYALRKGRASGATTSFDVNYRPSLWRSRQHAAEELRALANTADVVFIGLDEAHALWRTETPDDVRRLLPDVGSVVIKDGGRDARCFSGDDLTVVPALEVEVLEPVGAGDAFAAGWLHGLMSDLPQVTRLRLGHLMARASLQSVTDHGVSPLDGRMLLTQATSEASWQRLAGHLSGGRI